MELSAETFADFINRLKYHNTGAGVNDHATAHPIFIVQCCRKITGIDLDYDPKSFWTDEDREVQWTDEEFEEALADYVAEGGFHEEFDPQCDTEVTCGQRTIFEKIGYMEQWEYVNSHFTPEAAEAFIKRKKHDYAELRVYVDSQYWCPEFKAIVDGLINGKIIFKEEKDAVE